DSNDNRREDERDNQHFEQSQEHLPQKIQNRDQCITDTRSIRPRADNHRQSKRDADLHMERKGATILSRWLLSHAWLSVPHQTLAGKLPWPLRARTTISS